MLALASSAPSRVICYGLAATLLLVGCTTATRPTAPATTEALPAIAPSIPIGRTGDLDTGLATMGLFDFQLDPSRGTFELTPARAATANGDAFTLDLTTAFTTTKFGCADCLAIKSVVFDPSQDPDAFDVEFVATHPFPSGDVAGRADLHVNNVRLAFLVNGTDTFFGGEVTGDAGLVQDPDGYIKLPATFVAPPPGLTSTFFPFQIFQTGDNVGNPTGNFSPSIGWSGAVSDPQGFNVLKMGGQANTTVRFNIESGDTKVLDGQVALLANFVASATFDTRPNPTYYMPEGAMPEAWHVTATGPAGLTDEATDQNGTVSVFVTDWQAGATIDPAFPNPGNPGGLKTGGNVASVSVNIPAFNATPAPVTTPTSGAGTLATPWVFDVVVSKPASLTTAGTYVGLVKVLDERTPFNALDKSLDVATGLSSLSELATYQTFTTEVIVDGGGGYEPPLLGPATMFGPSVSTNDQPSGTLISPDRISRMFDSVGDTVVVVFRKQAPDFLSFAVASNDGGTTWGTPIALDPAATGGGASSFQAVAIALSADATEAYVVGSEFTLRDLFFSRLNLSGNTLTLDPAVRAVVLSSIIGPSSDTFEVAIAAHPTDPEMLYVAADDANGTVSTRRFMMMAVVNAASATTPAQVGQVPMGGTANGAAWTTDPSFTRIDDPSLEIGPDGDVYACFDPGRTGIDPGIFCHWDSGTDTFSAPVVFDGLVTAEYGDFSEARIGVGPDSRPVIVYHEAANDPILIMKAALPTAPWNFTSPVPVDPDYNKIAQGIEEFPDLAVDATTGRIHVTIGDFRDAPTESQASPLLVSLFESIFEPDLTLTIDGRKIDDPGLGDNTDGDRNLRIHILQRGTPTTKRWFYFWQDADAKNPAVGPDLLYKIGV